MAIHPAALLVELAVHEDLPVEGAERLLRHEDPIVRTQAVRHPGLAEKVRQQYMKDPSSSVTRAALGSTKDTSLLRVGETTQRERARGVAVNPLTDPDVLGELLAHSDTMVVRDAMTNPSSREEDVLAAARRHSACELFEVDMVSSYSVNGVDWVMSAHPSVADVWANGPTTAGLRSLAAHCRISEAAASALLRRGRGSWIRAVALNPDVPDEVANQITGASRSHLRLRGQMSDVLAGSSLKEAAEDVSRQRALADIGSASVDRALVHAASLSRAVARGMADRDTAMVQLEGLALSAFLNRFGGEMAGIVVEQLSRSRRAGAVSRSAHLRLGTERRNVVFSCREDAAMVIEKLDRDVQAWEGFMALLPSWDGSAFELADTVTRV